MKTIQSDYHSYLLRLWRVKEDGDDWRASLEDVVTGELHGFTDLAALIQYLGELDNASRMRPHLRDRNPLKAAARGEGRGLDLL
jgi:hypothetical protein